MGGEKEKGMYAWKLFTKPHRKEKSPLADKPSGDFEPATAAKI